MLKTWFIIITVTVLSLGAIYFFLNRNLHLQTQKNIFTPMEVSPSPIPFEEITIPYLRALEYKSSLGNLEKVSENSNYTSYLTSYDSDGLKINGLITQPKGTKPEGGWPAIVFIHGYIPPAQYQTLGRQYSDYVAFFARNNFVVFKIDLRGHGDSEGEPGGAYYSPDYIIDALNAYSALQSASFVNPQKIGLWGHSMAGNVVLRSMAAKPEIPAAVIWAGAGFSYLDLNQLGISDNSYQAPQDATERQRKRQILRETYGNPVDGNPFWKLVAPTSYLNDLKGVIALHHAVNDEVVSVEYSRNLNRLLNQQAVTSGYETPIVHEFHEYQSGGHNLSGNSFNQAMQRSVEFFEKYLKP